MASPSSNNIKKNPLIVVSVVDVGAVVKLFTDSNCSYNARAAQSIDSRSADQKALSKYTLTSGEEIWDLSGKAGEWKDYTIGGNYETFSSSYSSI